MGVNKICSETGTIDYSHFTDGEAEVGVGAGLSICPESHSWQVVKPELESRWTVPVKLHGNILSPPHGQSKAAHPSSGSLREGPIPWWTEMPVVAHGLGTSSHLIRNCQVLQTHSQGPFSWTLQFQKD